MSDSVNEPTDQSKVDPRDDLFYLLQKLSVMKVLKESRAEIDAAVSNEHSVYPQSLRTNRTR